MNAYFIRKRDQSLQWLWACLAVGELLAWVASGLSARHETAEGFGIVWMILLMLAVPLLTAAALVHYFFGCAYYASAKGRNNAYLCAVCALFFSLFATPFFVVFAVACDYIWTVYFAIPAVFALAALPFKLMQDRSVPDDVERLS